MLPCATLCWLASPCNQCQAGTRARQTLKCLPAQGVPGLFAGLTGPGSKDKILMKLRRLEGSYKACQAQLEPAMQRFLHSTSMSHPQQPHVARECLTVTTKDTASSKIHHDPSGQGRFLTRSNRCRY